MNVNEQILNERIDPHLTAESLSEVASRALGLPVHARFGRVLTGGCWNRVISVRVAANGGGTSEAPRDLVFKISPREGDAGIEREFAVLRYFAENTRMPVPLPYRIESSGAPIPGTVLVMSRIPGAVLHGAYATLTARDQRRVNDEVTRHVLDLHEQELSGFGGVELPGGERHEKWGDFWLPRFDKAMAEARESGVIEEAFFRRVDDVRPHFEAWLEPVRRATLTHYDIWSGNVMVHRENGEAHVSGFIDIPGFAADYAREISFMLMFGMADEAFLRAYGERHGFDDGFALRVNMYNLKMHTKHITMYPSQHYYRQGAEECLRYLEEKMNGST